MITWPRTLVREVAQQRCVLFLGAGVSASSKAGDGSRPPTWEQFLKEAVGLIGESALRSEVQSLITDRRFLLALQGVRTHADPGDYLGLLNKHFNAPKFQPSAVHDVIFRLDSRLVITTNFDKIYDQCCHVNTEEGFKTIPYDSTSLGDEIRSDTRLIIKAHGSIDDPAKMIFTRGEYHAAKKNHPQFYDVLKAIFLTQTVLFIGCGLDDPDVLLVLEDVKVTSSATRPHYAVVLDGQHSSTVVSDWASSYNVKTLPYGPDYDALPAELESLAVEVETARVGYGAVPEEESGSAG